MTNKKKEYSEYVGMDTGGWKIVGLDQGIHKKSYFDCICSCGLRKKVLCNSIVMGLSKQCAFCASISRKKYNSERPIVNLDCPAVRYVNEQNKRRSLGEQS